MGGMDLCLYAPSAQLRRAAQVHAAVRAVTPWNAQEDFVVEGEQWASRRVLRGETLWRSVGGLHATVGDVGLVQAGWRSLSPLWQAGGAHGGLRPAVMDLYLGELTVFDWRCGTPPLQPLVAPASPDLGAYGPAWLRSPALQARLAQGQRPLVLPEDDIWALWALQWSLERSPRERSVLGRRLNAWGPAFAWLSASWFPEVNAAGLSLQGGLGLSPAELIEVHAEVPALLDRIVWA